MANYRYKKVPDAFKTFHAAVLRKRELCTNQCPIFYTCPYAKYTDLVKKENPCMVATMPPEEQQQFISIFVLGEEGLKGESLRMLHRMARTLNLKDDAREMKIYLEAVTQVARTFKQQGKKAEPKEIEPITIDMSVLKLDKKEKIDPLVPPDPDEFLLNDKQSLYASPRLEGIIANPKKRNILKQNGNS